MRAKVSPALVCAMPIRMGLRPNVEQARSMRHAYKASVRSYRDAQRALVREESAASDGRRGRTVRGA